MKYKLAKWLYIHLGTHYNFDDTTHQEPPGDGLTFHFNTCRVRGGPTGTERFAQVKNDGFELWFGLPNEWITHMRHEEARALAWFIIWTWWIKGTWLGLRRKLWYWALTAKLDHDVPDRKKGKSSTYAEIQDGMAE